MTRDKILSDLFTSKDFTSCIAKMKPENLQDELKAEVALILCEMNEDKLIGLAERKELKFYTVRIILNLIQSKSSPFYKKFRDLRYIDFIPNNDRTRAQDLFTILENRYSNSVLANEDNFAVVSRDGFWEKMHSLIIDEGKGYDDRHDRAIAEIDNLEWYDREMLKLYAEYGTYRKIQDVTQIPWESAYKTIRKACREIKSKIE